MYAIFCTHPGNSIGGRATPGIAVEGKAGDAPGEGEAAVSEGKEGMEGKLTEERDKRPNDQGNMNSKRGKRISRDQRKDRLRSELR